MQIILLRHGLSTANELRLVCGATDYPLSKVGIKQAEAVCKNLKNIPFANIYVSPLSRARQTVAPLGECEKITIVNDLTELDTGDYSHLQVDDLWKMDPRYKYQGLNPDLSYPNGESLNRMISRVWSWFEKSRKLWEPQDNILIVGHEGTACAILHKLLGIEISNYPTFSVRNCECVHISLNEDGQSRYKFVPLLDFS